MDNKNNIDNIYHIGDVDAGSVATSDDAQSKTSAGFLHEFDVDEIEHDVVLFGARLVPEDGHFNLTPKRHVSDMISLCDEK